MTELGPLLRIVRTALREFTAGQLLDLDRPPLPAHIDVVDDRLIVHLMVTAASETSLAGQVEVLQAAGFRLNAYTEHVASGWTYLDTIDELAATKVDLFVEAASVVRPELDAAVPEAMHAVAGQAAPANCGAGVLIGLLDSGIDVAHNSLRNPSGDTRVAYLWDQTLPSAVPSPASRPYPYGAAWAATDIDASLAAGVALPTLDRSGHGTAVAGVAAANGRAAPAATYRGVAESADLLVVKLDAKAHAFPSSANILDAMRCVFDTARDLDRRAVVNLSHGGRLGPHDERGDLEVAIADLLAEDDSRVVVTSAGNLGDSDAHVRIFVPDGGAASVVMDVPRFGGPYVAVECWYDLSDWVEVTVTDPAGQSTPSVAGGDHRLGVLSDLYDIAGVRNAGRSRANCFLIVLRATTANGDVTPGAWTLNLHGASIAGTEPLDAWLDASDTPARFRRSTRECTVTSPGNADGVLAVTAYQMAPSVGPMATRSSQGPGRTGRSASMLAAPGGPVTTCAPANRSAANHTRQSGTSLAAAMVSGAVAAMIQADPEITRADVIDCLFRTARADSDVGAGPADAWGAGKLDILAAVQCAADKRDAPKQDEAAASRTAAAAARQVRFDALRHQSPTFTIRQELP